MPRYVIERQYLVPMFEHIMVEASTFEDACREATDDIAQPWSEDAELCFDDARSTTVTCAIELPDDYDLNREGNGLNDCISLSSLLYCAGFEPLVIAPEFGTEGREEPTIGFV
jgi:hypothetical protein